MGVTMLACQEPSFLELVGAAALFIVGGGIALGLALLLRNLEKVRSWLD